MPGHISTINPASGEPLRTYETMDAAAIESALSGATTAQVGWGARSRDERALVLRTAAKVLRARRDELAALAVTEMGKPMSQARAEVDKCALACEYYGGTGAGALDDVPVATVEGRAWTTRDPLGVVLAVMPWNFPYWQVFRFAAPALVAGNAALLKHSPNVSACALAVQDILREAGLPADVFTTLLVDEATVSDVVAGLIDDDRVAAVTFTGSGRAGSHIGSAAGRAIKKTVLELGGSDPFIVLSDADLETVVPHAVTSRFLNGGQSCLAAKRFLVHESLAAEFEIRFTEAVEKLVVGDPAEESTQIGPLARKDLVENLERQVAGSVRLGARVLTGGQRLDRGSCWYAPTVLTDVSTDMPVMSEETFGPVAAVTSFTDDDDAVRLANLTDFGLGASVWSRDEEHALAVGAKVTSGALFVNAVVASDPLLPFGGVKQSGYGRELGAAGAQEFTNLRTIVVR